MQAKLMHRSDELLRIAVDAAAEAARLIRTAIESRGALVWEEKGSADFVTEAYARQFVEVSRHTAAVRRAGSAALDLANTA